MRSGHVVRSTIVVLGPSVLLLVAFAAGAVATLLYAVGPVTPERAVATLVTAGLAPLVLIVRPWYRRWGATDAELARALPGDAVLPRPVAETTRAITIAAPADAVWRWLVQLGQGRGGLYSYDWLENLAGLDIHSVDRVVPELQHLAVGDPVPLGPGLHNGWVVAAVQAGRSLVLRLDAPGRGGAVDHEQPRWFDTSYDFELVPVDARTTRLLLRFRFDGRPRPAVARLYALLVELPHFIMERKMLLGIRRRAEALAHDDVRS
jgi:hypothetical protein